MNEHGGGHGGAEDAMVWGSIVGEAFLELAILMFAAGVIFSFVMTRQLKDERRLSYQRFLAQVSAVVPGVVLLLGFPVIIIPTLFNLLFGVPAMVFHVRGLPYYVGYLFVDVLGISYTIGIAFAALTFLLVLVGLAIPIGMRIYPRMMPRDLMGNA